VKPFLRNSSLLDTIVEEISLLDPTSLPSSAMTKGVFFSFSFLTFVQREEENEKPTLIPQTLAEQWRIAVQAGQNPMR